MNLSAMSVLAAGGHGASVPVVDPTSAGSLALPLVLVIALPALGAAVLLLGGRRTDRFGHLLGCATVLASFVCSVILFVAILGRDADDRQVGLTPVDLVHLGPAGRSRWGCSTTRSRRCSCC